MPPPTSIARVVLGSLLWLFAKDMNQPFRRKGNRDAEKRRRGHVDRAPGTTHLGNFGCNETDCKEPGVRIRNSEEKQSKSRSSQLVVFFAASPSRRFTVPVRHLPARASQWQPCTARQAGELAVAGGSASPSGEAGVFKPLKPLKSSIR